MIFMRFMQEQKNMTSDGVTIVRARDVRSAVAGIMQAYGMHDLKDRHVLIKPNMFRGAAPEESVVTDPALVSAAVQYCLERNAHVEVGDNPVPNKGCTEIETAEQCGFLAAAHGYFVNIGTRSAPVVINKGGVGEVRVSRAVLDCDILISLPKFRTHELTVMTLAIKNHFGIIPGGLKPALHERFPKIADFSKILVEVYEIRPPDLVIVDALRFIDAGGRRFEPGILISGTNGHAVDYVCAQVAGIDPWRIPTLRYARDRGLLDSASVKIDGDMPVLRGYQLPFRFPLRGPIVEFFAQWLYALWRRRRPYINRAHCTRCGSCERVCPVHAIHDARIDHNRCIKCYCCFETCPHGAIRTRIKI
jgi:uncharacterized protein (DUF362 family)/NAD-dependent dihydropyrimidine dehydrogenase PreA subunit